MSEDVLHKTLRQLLNLEQSEVIKLRAELAAIRDAVDDKKIKEDFEALWTTVGCEDVDIDLVRGLVLQLRDITLDRGLKIAEQAKVWKAVENERSSYWTIYGDLQQMKAERANILPLIASAMEQHFVDHPAADNFLTWEITGPRMGPIEMTLRKCSGKTPAEAINELRSERDEAILKLANETKLYLGANEAQKQREISACERAKIPYGGCDTVHDLADVIEELREEIEQLKGERDSVYACIGEDLDSRCDGYVRDLPGTLLPEDASQDLLDSAREIFRDGVSEGFTRHAKEINEKDKQALVLVRERDEAIELLKLLVAYPSGKSQLENIVEYNHGGVGESAKRILELTAKREEK